MSKHPRVLSVLPVIRYLSCQSPDWQEHTPVRVGLGRAGLSPGTHTLSAIVPWNRSLEGWDH